MAAHLYVFYYGALSMITPPVCLAAFAGAAIAGGAYMRTGWEAVRLGLSAFLLPPLFVYSPKLLLVGDTVSIAAAITIGVVAIVFLAAALEGFLLVRLSIGFRVLTFFIAVLLAAAVVRVGDRGVVLAALALSAAAALFWLQRKRRSGGQERRAGIKSADVAVAPLDRNL